MRLPVGLLKFLSSFLAREHNTTRWAAHVIESGHDMKHIQCEMFT